MEQPDDFRLSSRLESLSVSSSQSKAPAPASVSVQEEMSKVAQDISKTELEIELVGRDIKKVEGQMESRKTEVPDVGSDKYFMLLMAEKAQLRAKEAQLRAKEAQLRDLEISQRVKRLGDDDGLYDVMSLISSRVSSASSSSFTGPSFHQYDVKMMKTAQEMMTVPTLSTDEFATVRRAQSLLWRSNSEGFVKTVDCGSSEALIDSYAKGVIMSVVEALTLGLRLEPQTFIRQQKADHWVVKAAGSVLVGCVECKLPSSKNGLVLDDDRFTTQIYGQMMEVAQYYSTRPVYGIGTTGRDWRFFHLEPSGAESPKTPAKGKAKACVTFMTPKKGAVKEKDSSPPASFAGPADAEEIVVDEDAADGDGFGREEEFQFVASKVYKWDESEMLQVLGGVLQQMAAASQDMSVRVDDGQWSKRIMWHLIKMNSKQPWGWATLAANQPRWHKFFTESTQSVVVLSMLGHGADGKALLVANSSGNVGVLKMMHGELESLAGEEAQLWATLYGKEYPLLKQVRAETWMGMQCVIMPRLNQFAVDERKANLDNVRQCLETHFADKGYQHGDVAWRNVAYIVCNQERKVIMLDLNPQRVKKVTHESRQWIDEAILKLSGKIQQALADTKN
jgi:hypothetical protein